MKRIFILILIFLLFGMMGCQNENVPVINQGDVDYVNQLIGLIEDEITEDDRELIQLIREEYDALSEEEKALIVNYDKLEYAEAIIASIDEEKRRLEQQEQTIKEILEGLETTLDAMIPDEVSDNVELIREFKNDLGDIEVKWKSSNINTFSNYGVVIPGRKDIIVNVLAELRFIPYDETLPSNITHTFRQTVRVKAISLPKLPTKNLTFAYSYNGRGFDEKAIATIDVVNHAFSSVVGGVVSVGILGREELLELRKQGVRISLCIGGYKEGAIPFSAAAATQEGREKLAKSIVDAIEKYHFDGVDIDWEYPGYESAPGVSEDEDKENYTLFIGELRKQVKRANADYLVTAAVPGGPFTSSRYNIGDLNEHLDYFLLMTYDLHNTTLTTHHTALYSSSFTIRGCTVDETVNNYISKGASASKLVVGAAFYGRVFTLDYDGDPYGQGKAQYQKSISYGEIVRSYLNKEDVLTFWDDVAKAPYLYDPNTKTFITYDDPDSIAEKINYVSTHKLAGIMFWEFSQDNGDLLNAIYEHMG